MIFLFILILEKYDGGVVEVLHQWTYREVYPNFINIKKCPNFGKNVKAFAGNLDPKVDIDLKYI